MKNIFTLIILINFQFIFTQNTVIIDSLKITLTKTKKVSNKFNTRSSVKITGKEFQKVLIRCKIEALNKKKVDINAFSLIDTVNKLRYRLSDYLGYKGFSFAPGNSEMLLKTALKDKKGKPYIGIPKYQPEIKDSFENYNIKGYENIDYAINFGINRTHSNAEAFDKKKYLISKIYFSPNHFNKFTADMFFTILKKQQQKKLFLYYKDQKLFNIDIKKL